MIVGLRAGPLKVLELFPRQPAVNTELDKLTPREQGVLRSLDITF